MRTIEDLVTDIASIVTSVRPGELMTLKKVEEDYRAIYRTVIPFYEYGYSSVEKLLESYPNHFKFSTADGILIVRTNVKTNITDLIAKEKISKKPKCFSLQNNVSNSPFKKHKRREMKVEPQLPIMTMKNIGELLINNKRPIRQDDFLTKFQTTCGYELKYLDYGFLNFEEMLDNLNGKYLNWTNHLIYPHKSLNKSITDYIQEILSTNTGFNVSTIQEYISNISVDRISDLMKVEGFVNFIDVIYDASQKKLLSYDFDLIYPYTDRVARKCALYPSGVSEIRFLHVNTPKDFIFKIVANEQQPGLDFIDSRMRQLSSQMQLLSLFKEHKICAVEYDSMWYRARIVAVCCDKNFESLSLRFIDHPIEIEHGICISLPTDRVRFLPPDLEMIPAFIHRGSLAYVKPVGSGYKWSKEAIERFVAAVHDDSFVYQSYFVSQADETVSIDVVTWDRDGHKHSVFHELLSQEIVRVDFK